ncbi:MAG TPA: tetratricopeptide repeat protein [Chthoniobacterales bacterium]|jgi:tetratricopeptide (TPR) repeat protein
MPNEKSNDPDPSAGESESSRQPRRSGLTPEQRRFLNRPRSSPNEPAHEETELDKPKTDENISQPEPTTQLPAPDATDENPNHHQMAAAPLQQFETASRRFELQQAFLIIGGFFLLGLTFYVGTKYNYLKSLAASRQKPTLSDHTPDQFPGVDADDLVDQALVAERDGKWEEAVVRLMAAKRKDLQYRGILFRVGKILYDHRIFDQAAKAFEQAVAFGENVEAAHYYRGLIAMRRKNLAAAELYFQAAVDAAPFVSDYHYFLGEAFRLDLKPAGAIAAYEKAGLLARDEQDAKVCAFKVRMARIEAAESAAVSAELAKAQASGPLSVDWLLTAAALEIREGHLDAARKSVEQARNGIAPGLFDSCLNDMYFRDAAKRFPELADALRPNIEPQENFPDLDSAR